jgi:GTPase SAR1 family protein
MDSPDNAPEQTRDDDYDNNESVFFDDNIPELRRSGSRNSRLGAGQRRSSTPQGAGDYEAATGDSLRETPPRPRSRQSSRGGGSGQRRTATPPYPIEIENFSFVDDYSFQVCMGERLRQTSRGERFLRSPSPVQEEVLLVKYEPKRRTKAVQPNEVVGLRLTYGRDGIENESTAPCNTNISFIDHVFDFSNNASALPEFFHPGSRVQMLAWHDDYLESGVCLFHEVVVLDLYNNRLTNLIAGDILRSMPNLQKLIYRSNLITVPEDGTYEREIFEESITALSQMSQFTSLDLQKNCFNAFPTSLCKVERLIDLDISHNSIQSLPVNLLDSGCLSNLQKFKFHNNRMTSPMENAVKENDILGLRDYLQSKKIRNQELKVVLIGTEEAGKTTLSKSIIEHFGNEDRESPLVSTPLLDVPHFEINRLSRIITPTKSTVGIDIRQCVVNNEENRDIALHLWDFAGQDLYHSVHEVFFSENALYILVWDVRKTNYEDTIYFWVDLITARVQGPTILIVATHLDGSQSSDLSSRDKLKRDILSSLMTREVKKRKQMEDALNKIGNAETVPKIPTFLGPYFVGCSVTAPNISDRRYDNFEFDNLMADICHLVTPYRESIALGKFDDRTQLQEKVVRIIDDAKAQQVLFLDVEDLCQRAENALENKDELFKFLSSIGKIAYDSYEDKVGNDFHRTLFLNPLPQDEIPFGMIGAEYPQEWEVIKSIIDEAQAEQQPFIYLEDLYLRAKSRLTDLKRNKLLKAVQFLSFIGKIVYFHNHGGRPDGEIHRMIFLNPGWVMRLIKTVLNHNKPEVHEKAA